MLSPRQRKAFKKLVANLDGKSLPISVLYCADGLGRTSVLEALQRERGGVLLSSEHVLTAMRPSHPLAIEEVFEATVRQALSSDDLVLVDDVHHVRNVVSGCRAYPRSGWISVALDALTAHCAKAGKRLVLGSDGALPDPIGRRAFHARIDEFEVEDYAALCRLFVGEGSAVELDFDKIFRFAPKLNAWYLRAACGRVEGSAGDCTRAFVDYLRARLGSNVDIDEVQQVDLASLRGLDDVLDSLEANVILPLENDELARSYALVPKRGVLLVGPPGTGKTTIGRALAHRLKGKFLMVDGTFISGTRDFYQRIQQVFEAAKRNAPAVVFIDDSDAIFESGDELGLYRYLLTQLDGLESKGSGRVCVMMTAMDVGNLPPALVRSGRIELWLETKLPNEAARAAILRDLAARLPETLRTVDVDGLTAATEQFTGADLERLVEDGKALYAWRLSRGAAPASVTECFLAAVATVRQNKERYAEAEQRARSQRKRRPTIFDIGAYLPDGAG